MAWYTPIVQAAGSVGVVPDYEYEGSGGTATQGVLGGTFGGSGTKAKEAAAQAEANAQLDEFDLLLREAMFAAVGQAPSARARTFATTPRGIEGPAGKVMGQAGMVSGDVNVGSGAEAISAGLGKQDAFDPLISETIWRNHNPRKGRV